MATDSDSKRHQAPNTNSQDKPQPATPAQIANATTEIAGLLAKFTAAEQGRIIRAAASINGLDATNRQQGGRR